MSEKTNIGGRSTGFYSTGDYSTGDYSTGNASTGNASTGNYSTGGYSTGDQSKGYASTGYCSTGCRSTGHHSTGHYSTGDWSTSDYSAGHFCTIDGLGFSAFNKPIHKDIKKSLEEWDRASKPSCLFFSLTVWVWEKDMSEAEKRDNPTHKTTGGYLKTTDYKTAFSSSVLAASKEERDLIRALPNFDDEVFLEISGVDLRLVD